MRVILSNISEISNNDSRLNVTESTSCKNTRLTKTICISFYDASY